jgi:hypothetical protein
MEEEQAGETIAQMCKLLQSPGIDSKELIPGLLKRLQIRAQTTLFLLGSFRVPRLVVRA